MALLVGGSSMLAEVGNGGHFFWTLDEECLGPLVLELWSDSVPWMKSESCVGLCSETPTGGATAICLHALLLQPEP